MRSFFVSTLTLSHPCDQFSHFCLPRTLSLCHDVINDARSLHLSDCLSVDCRFLSTLTFDQTERRRCIKCSVTKGGNSLTLVQVCGDIGVRVDIHLFVHLGVHKIRGCIGSWRLGLAFLSMRKISHQRRYAPRRSSFDLVGGSCGTKVVCINAIAGFSEIFRSIGFCHIICSTRTLSAGRTR